MGFARRFRMKFLLCLQFPFLFHGDKSLMPPSTDSLDYLGRYLLSVQVRTARGFLPPLYPSWPALKLDLSPSPLPLGPFLFTPAEVFLLFCFFVSHLFHLQLHKPLYPSLSPVSRRVKPGFQSDSLSFSCIYRTLHGLFSLS